MKVKVKGPRGRPGKDGNSRLGKTSYKRKEDYWKKLRRSCRKTEIDGEVWLSDDSLRVGKS
jgi:hypothetical protein